jgi:undecaprenyl-diphosphatase
MTWLEAIILGLVEGITEFLPVSSTGHLILTQSLLGLKGPAIEALLIIIQGPAILAVCWEFRKKLLHTAFSVHREPASRRFVVNLLIVFLPVAVLALLFGDAIKAALFKPVTVAIALVVGGVIILWAERRNHVERVQDVDQLTNLDALKLGAFQALSLIPGTSRSGATIIGGLLCGLSRKTAAEFSFFVAVPVLISATVYELWKERTAIAGLDAGPIVMSCIVSFVSALLAVKFFIRFVSRHSFAMFAWYRIVFGVVILVTAWTGLVSW